MNTSSAFARQTFLNSEEMVADGNNYRLTKDLTFRSPSGAAATITARSINGWTAWKDSATGISLDESVRRARDDELAPAAD